MANKRLSSTGWLVKETIKGMPAAAVKVGKAVVGGVGKVGKAITKPMMEYKKNMENRAGATPAGSKMIKGLKEEGIIKTIKKIKSGKL